MFVHEKRFSTIAMGGPIMSLTLQLLRIPTSKHLKKIVVRLTDLTGRACSTTGEYTHFDLEVMGINPNILLKY